MVTDRRLSGVESTPRWRLRALRPWAGAGWRPIRAGQRAGRAAEPGHDRAGRALIARDRRCRWPLMDV